MFLPCVCEEEHIDCGFVFYYPQEVTKGEKLAVKAGYEIGFVLAYKLCEFCSMKHRLKPNIWDTIPIG